MRRIGGALLLGILLSTLSGCGSFSNLAGYDHWVLMTLDKPNRPPIPFGGVINNGGMLVRAAKGGLIFDNLLFTSAVLVDAPLSLAVDVVTLPLATYWCVSEFLSPTDNYRGGTFAPSVADNVLPPTTSNEAPQ